MTRSIRFHLAGIALTLSTLISALVSSRALAQPFLPSDKAPNVAATLQGPDFDASVKATQKQSQTVTRAAATQSAADSKPNYARDLLQSDGFDREIKHQKSQNAESASSITPTLIGKIQKMLPKSAPYVGRLAIGTHVTVSQSGEEIIDLIRTLATSNPAGRESLLAKLQAFSENGAPEALNFMGLIFEHGLFGARSSMPKALAYYKSAASAGYQPGTYNLALAAAYGRDSDSSKGATNAGSLIARAASLGDEASYRVCGLGSFLSMRRNDQTAAVNFARNCFSPLAGLSKATFNQDLTTQERVKLLRDSLSTGADDGYPLLENVTRKDAATDPSFTYCKYLLLNRYRQTKNLDGVRDSASRCHRQFVKATGNKAVDNQMHDQAVAGITGFVSTEAAELKQIRQSNHFHYSWSVPYLPFMQADVDHFAPLLSPPK